MATQPQYFPDIAKVDTTLPNTGNDNKLRPQVETREVGYGYLQKVPAEEFNWIVNNISEWIQYLNDLSKDEAITEIATREQAEQGQASDVLMTPQRVLQSIQFNAVPPGNVEYTAATSAPAGYLFCDGSAVSRSTYARLYDAIGTVWGSGDGSTTFNVPDLRDEFIRGANPGGGRAVGTAESDEIRSHTHTGDTGTAGAHSHDYRDSYYIESYGGNYGGNENIGGNYRGAGDTDSDNNYLWYINRTTESVSGHSHSFITDSTGGSETRPQNKALLPIIKT